MFKKIFLIFFFPVLFFSTSFAQDTKEDIQRKQQDLQRELNDLNNTLASIKKNKRQSLGQLALVQRKIGARQALINNLGKQMHRIDDDLYQNEVQVNHLRLELDTLKKQYAESLVFAYKNRSNYDYLNFLFSASSFNDAIKRVAYLRSYRQFRETQSADINKTQDLMQQKIAALNSSKMEKSNTINEEGAQLNNLKTDEKEKDDVVNQLKSQETEVASQIKVKEKSRQKLKQSLDAIIRRAEAEARERAKQEAIEKQAEIERQRKAAAAQQQQSASTNPSSNKPVVVNNPPPTSTSGSRTYSPLETTTEGLDASLSFEAKRGRLPWPVEAGNVTSPFGPHSIPGTKLHEDNPGIDISLPAGATVKSVADGNVTSVFNLGDAQAVVIKHGKYFTTYSNLSSVSVNKGDDVHAGTVVGRAGTGDDGQGLLTFVVSNEKGNLDPENWLRSR